MRRTWRFLSELRRPDPPSGPRPVVNRCSKRIILHPLSQRRSFPPRPTVLAKPSWHDPSRAEARPLSPAPGSSDAWSEKSIVSVARSSGGYTAAVPIMPTRVTSAASPSSVAFSVPTGRPGMTR